MVPYSTRDITACGTDIPTWLVSHALTSRVAAYYEAAQKNFEAEAPLEVILEASGDVHGAEIDSLPKNKDGYVRISTYTSTQHLPTRICICVHKDT